MWVFIDLVLIVISAEILRFQILIIKMTIGKPSFLVQPHIIKKKTHFSSVKNYCFLSRRAHQCERQRNHILCSEQRLNYLTYIRTLKLAQWPMKKTLYHFRICKLASSILWKNCANMTWRKRSVKLAYLQSNTLLIQLINWNSDT